MKILWIGRTGAAGCGGDVVFDKKIVSILVGQGYEVIEYTPRHNHILYELFLMFTFIVPIQRARFVNLSNFRNISMLSRDVDFTVISWEGYDFLANSVNGKYSLIWHNISSDVYRQTLTGLRRLILAPFISRLKHWEVSITSRLLSNCLQVLSCSDKAIISELTKNKNLSPLVILPGAPQPTSLSDGYSLDLSLTLSGTYDWFAKRNDLIKLFASLVKCNFSYKVISLNDIPAKLSSCIKGFRFSRVSDIGDRSRILSFGIIPDTFVAGHKLKLGFFISNNYIPIVFVDVYSDFYDIDDARFFIRKVGCVSEIEAVFLEFSRLDPVTLRLRFERFKAAVCNRLSWELAGSDLAKNIEKSI